MITKAVLQKRSGLNDRQIAEMFGISWQAVQQWPKDEPIPPARELAWRGTNPELFAKKAKVSK